MASRRFVLGGAALAALFARLRRRPDPDQALDSEDEAEEEVAAEEVHELREELRRELERLAEGEIKASRTPRESNSPPG